MSKTGARSRFPRPGSAFSVLAAGLLAALLGSLPAGSASGADAAPEPASPAAPAPAPARKPDLILLFTGEIDGWFQHCGCLSHPKGGVAWRAGYIRKVREENPGVPLLVLDGGNLLGQPGVAGDMRSRLLLEAASAFGYDAINVGPLEAGRWGELPALSGGRTLPWVSTNLSLPEGAGAPPPALREFTFPGLKIAVVGLAEPDRPIEGVTFRPSLAALQATLATLTDPAERIVVIGRIPVTRAAVVSSVHPGILAVLSGYGVMNSDTPLSFGSAVAAFCGEQGMHMIDLRLSLRGDRPSVLSYQLVPLDRTIPSPPEWQKKMDETLKAVKAVDFDFTPPESDESPGEPAAPSH